MRGMPGQLGLGQLAQRDLQGPPTSAAAPSTKRAMQAARSSCQNRNSGQWLYLMPVN